MKLGEIVAAYRKEHGLSQRQFGEICGFSNAYISMLERDRNPGTGRPLAPTLDTYRALARAMGTTMDALMSAVEADTPVEVNSPGLTDLSPEERDLIRKLRQLDERGRRAVYNVLNFELKALEE